MKTPTRAPYLLFDAGFGAARAFVNPSRMIVANRAEQVQTAFAELQAAHRAGAFLAGFCSYELGYALEQKLLPHLPEAQPTPQFTPLLCFGVFDAPATDDEKNALLNQAKTDRPAANLTPPKPLWSAEKYAQAFARAHAYICAGDFYQMNLTFPMEGAYTGSPLGLYAALAEYQPVDFGALIDFTAAVPDAPVLLSRSPELFFHLASDGAITTRPMKGTLPRGRDAREDAAAARYLQMDAKNRAENLMIVDLLRNDLSKIATAGSVRVPELFTIQSYETVHQMVSRICATARPNLTIADIFTALFPCGSITGAPKIRAMSAIAELENAPRGGYCGSIGVIAPDGQMCFNVAIRTLALFGDGRARLNVGGGVVYDSTAAAEYEEALWKARFAKTSPRG